MLATKDIVNYLDEYLRIREIKDDSLNGLQVQGRPEVEKLGFAVDASLDAFEAARAANVDLLIVHHGLFWGREQPITHSHYHRIRLLIESGLNLYCAHLPLDAHPEVGNNAQLASQLDLDVEYYFGQYKGTPIAVYARARKKLHAGELLEKLKTVVGEHVRLDEFGPQTFRNIGICSGAGASFIPEAKQLGMEAFITGEPRHSYYNYSKEEKMHIYYGRHYDTETLGLKALADHLQDLFKLPTQFFDLPSFI
ncbi:MAG: Nif3-like dinuclear metal center hexameric protein [Calditrichaeota bacterium]|nr:MAG: Nif3-like dinuclear metal center hexameric protein [Calditrichota bacterium]